MMSKKIILSISMLAIGIVGSLYVVGSAEKDKDVSNFISDDFLTAIQQDLLARNVGDLQNLQIEDGNLTDLLSYAYASYLMDNHNHELEILNKGGGYVELPIITMQDITNDSFEVEAAKIIRDLTANKYESSDLKISRKNDGVEQEKYFNDIANAFEKTIGEFQLNSNNMIIEWMRTGDSTEMTRYYISINSLLNELLSIDVPPSWVSFHLKNLNIWNKQRAILKALSDIERDPLKSIVALDSLSTIYKDLESLDKELIKATEKYHE